MVNTPTEWVESVEDLDNRKHLDIYCEIEDGPVREIKRLANESNIWRRIDARIIYYHLLEYYSTIDLKVSSDLHNVVFTFKDSILRNIFSTQKLSNLKKYIDDTNYYQMIYGVRKNFTQLRYINSL